MRNIWHLIVLMRSFWGWLVLSILLGFAAIASGVGLMGTSAYLISRAALQPSIAVLQVAIVGVRFFGITRGIFRYFERLVSHSVNLRMVARMRRWFFDVLEPLTPTSNLHLKSGDLLSRALADIGILEDFYIRVVSPPLIAVLITSGIGLFIGSISLALAYILVGGLLLSGLCIPLLSQTLRRKSGERLTEINGELSAIVSENIQGIQEILAYNLTKTKQGQVEKLGDRLAEAQKIISWRESLVEALNIFFPSLTLWFTLLVAIPLVSRGELEGVLLAVIALTVLASFEAVSPLGVTAKNLELSIHATQRLFGLLKIKPQVEKPAAPLVFPNNPGIVVKRLSFRYIETGRTILDDLSFELFRGQRKAIIGPSGSGKTTLINLLLRLWDVMPGMITFEGLDIRNFALEDARRQFSVISQTSYLFGGSVRKNLLLSNPAASDERINSVLRQVELEPWLRQLPAGLNTWLGENGVKVSGGEYQRLIIARAVLQNAPIWLIDEPTTNLDPLSELLILKLLFKLTENKTTLWITHRLNGMEKMDEILVLQDGRIAERGKHQDLVHLNGLYNFFLQTQNGIR